MRGRLFVASVLVITATGSTACSRRVTGSHDAAFVPADTAARDALVDAGVDDAAPADADDVAAPCVEPDGAPPGTRDPALQNRLVRDVLTPFYVKTAWQHPRTGEIYVLGNSICHAGDPHNFATLVRLTPDGEIDESFGEGGRFCLNDAAREFNRAEGFYSLALDAEGRLVVGGLTHAWDGAAVTGPRQALLVRLRVADVAHPPLIDTSFARTGVARFSLPGSLAEAMVFAVAIDGRGRIVIAGSDHEPEYADASYGFIWRWMPDGTPDRAFAGGRPLVDVDSRGYFAMTLDAAGGVAAAGTQRSVAFEPVVLRLDERGERVRTFGDQGRARAVPQYVNGGGMLTRAIVPDARGGYVLAGAAVSEFEWRTAVPAIVRVDAAGAFDDTFGDGGFVQAAGVWDFRNQFTGGLAMQCDGRLLLLHTSPEGASVLRRYLPDGRTDRTFPRTTVDVPHDGDGAWALSVFVAPDGAHATAVIRDFNNSSVGLYRFAL